MTEQFLYEIPEKIRKDPELFPYFSALAFWLDTISAVDGVLVTSENTAETVVTQQGEIEDTTSTANTADSKADTNLATLSALLNSLPAYTLSNNTTDRTLNANAAAGSISGTYVQSEIENLRDAQLGSDDTLATLIQDLTDKGLIS